MTYSDAFDATSEDIATVRDLLEGVIDLAFNHPALSTSDQSSETINTLLRLARDKANAALASHHKERGFVSAVNRACASDKTTKAMATEGAGHDRMPPLDGPVMQEGGEH